jgi:putative oxidoreductase
MSVLDTYAMLIGRVLIGLLFLVTGIQVAMGFSGFAGMLDSMGLPMTSLLAAVVVVIKIGGGAALIAGWNVRYASLALMAFIIATILLVHNNFDDQLGMMLKNLAILGGLLYVYKCGAGSHKLVS